jgi:nucleoside diphosphate kinase
MIQKRRVKQMDLFKVISGVYRKEGFIKKTEYALIVLEDQIIFAKVTKQMRKEEQKKLYEELKGKSFKERMLAVMTENKRVYERYQGRDIQSIIHETPGNFMIRKSDIKKVKTSLGQMYDDNHQPIAKKVFVITENEKHHLSFQEANQSDAAYQFLKTYVKS